MSAYGAWELKAGYQRNLGYGLAVSVLLFASLFFPAVLFINETPVDIARVDGGKIIFIPRPKPKPAPPKPPAPASRPPAQPQIGVFALDSVPDFEPAEQLEQPSPESNLPSDAAVGGPDDGTGPLNAASGEGPVDLGSEGIKPEILKRVQPVYPNFARERGLSETVVAELLVDKSGNVEKIVIVKSQTGIFDDAVAAALKKWVFRPLQIDGREVSFRYRETVVFRLR